MHRIEPVECPFGPLRAAAALTVVEPEQHERQRGRDLKQHHPRADDALIPPVVPGVFPVNNVFREDVVTNGDGSEDALKNAPVVKDGGFKVPKTIGD